jgi:hypothetical protein
VADKPIQEVPFGDGRIQQDGPALPDRLPGRDQRDGRQFLNPQTAADAEGEAETEDAAPKRKKKSGVTGLQDASTEGENMAILARKQLDFPFYYPKVKVAGSSYVGEPRFYTIRDELGASTARTAWSSRSASPASTTACRA